MSKPDLLAEHKALRTERAELRRLCAEQWESMSAGVARVRQERLEAIAKRLEAIAKRLEAIEHTKAWQRRPIGIDPDPIPVSNGTQMTLISGQNDND